MSGAFPFWSAVMIIDPHVHFRDWEQKARETILHGLESAFLCGISLVTDMPNCDPSLTKRETILRRLEDGMDAERELEKAIPALRERYSWIEMDLAPIYTVNAGITADPGQIEEVLALQKSEPRVAGVKLFAGSSTGGLAVPGEEEQRRVWRTLAQLSYQGSVAVHCEKESRFQAALWTPSIPASHSLSRPEEAESASIQDQLNFAEEAGFTGNLHICHISSPLSLELVLRFKREEKAGRKSFTLTCGATPHHLLLDASMIPDGPDGLFYKVNPPLRSRGSRRSLIAALLEGTIDWIESDHAPHLPRNKYRDHLSGIPSLVAWPLLIRHLLEMKISSHRLEEVSGRAALTRYGYASKIVEELNKRNLSHCSTRHCPPREVEKELFARYPANCWSSIDLPRG